MRFRQLEIDGAYLVEAEPIEDSRGELSRLFSSIEFERRGLAPAFPQESIVRSHRAGTLRGFHFQIEPYAEAKLVTCVRGSAFDVILDIRRGSSTFGASKAVRIYSGTWTGVYVPAGCAHAVQTLEDDTELLYRMSCNYVAAAASGFRWNSPMIKIRWPIQEAIVSERDQNLPFFSASNGS